MNVAGKVDFHAAGEVEASLYWGADDGELVESGHDIFTTESQRHRGKATTKDL
jgi:hypothetical protein